MMFYTKQLAKRNNMRNQIITLAFIITSSIAFAQPGYYGKKTNYKIGLSAFSVFGSTNYKGNTGIKAIDYKYSIEAERAINRRSTLALSYRFYRTTVPFDNSSDSYYFDDALEYLAYENNQLKIYSNLFLLHYRRYFKTPGLALLGSYVEYCGGVDWLKSRYEDEYFSVVMAHYISPVIGIGLGKKIVVKDRVTIEYGFYLKLHSEAFQDLVIIEDSNSSAFDELDIRIYTRNLQGNIVEFKLSLGLLTK